MGEGAQLADRPNPRRRDFDAADVDQIVAIDIAKGEVTGRHTAEGAKFLNDLTADKQGRVYASDMPTDTIWMLEGDKIAILLHDEELNNPNGLLALDDGRILVGSWGRMAEDFSTKVPGHMRVIDVASKKVSDLGDRHRSAISMASSPMVAAATWLPIG